MSWGIGAVINEIHVKKAQEDIKIRVSNGALANINTKYNGGNGKITLLNDRLRGLESDRA